MFTFSITKTLIIVAVIAIALAVVARNWSCRKQPEPRVRLSEYKVVTVTSSCTLRVKDRLRVKDLILEGVVSFPDVNVEGTANLAKLAGATIRLESKGGLFRSDEKQSTQDVPYEAATLHGKVFGENGSCLQVQQLRAGYVETIGKVPTEYTAAQQEAKKNKRGGWSK